MDTTETNAFESIADLNKIIAVRLLDDAGKSAQMKTPDLSYFTPLVQQVVISMQAMNIAE